MHEKWFQNCCSKYNSISNAFHSCNCLQSVVDMGINLFSLFLSTPARLMEILLLPYFYPSSYILFFPLVSLLCLAIKFKNCEDDVVPNIAVVVVLVLVSLLLIDCCNSIVSLHIFSWITTKSKDAKISFAWCIWVTVVFLYPRYFCSWYNFN